MVTRDGMIQSVREQRNLLCSIIDLPVPKSKVNILLLIN